MNDKPINQVAFDDAFAVFKAAFPDHYVVVVVANDVNGSLLTNMRTSRLESIMRGVMEHRTQVWEKET